MLTLTVWLKWPPLPTSYSVISCLLYSFLYSYIDWIFPLCLWKEASFVNAISMQAAEYLEVTTLKCCIHIIYYSVLVTFRWGCNMWCTWNTAKKSSLIQSHEFASSFLIPSVQFLEIFYEWFFIHGLALRSRQLFTGTSVALIAGISVVLRGRLAFIPLLSTRKT